MEFTWSVPGEISTIIFKHIKCLLKWFYYKYTLLDKILIIKLFRFDATDD